MTLDRLFPEQDDAKLQRAVKKEAETQRAVRAFINQNVSMSGTDSEVPNKACTTCNINLETGQARKCARFRAVTYCSRDCQATDWSEHKRLCQKQNFLLEVILQPDRSNQCD